MTVSGCTFCVSLPSDVNHGKKSQPAVTAHLTGAPLQPSWHAAPPCVRPSPCPASHPIPAAHHVTHKVAMRPKCHLGHHRAVYKASTHCQQVLLLGGVRWRSGAISLSVLACHADACRTTASLVPAPPPRSDCLWPCAAEQQHPGVCSKCTWKLALSVACPVRSCCSRHSSASASFLRSSACGSAAASPAACSASSAAFRSYGSVKDIQNSSFESLNATSMWTSSATIGLLTCQTAELSGQLGTCDRKMCPSVVSASSRPCLTCCTACHLPMRFDAPLGSLPLLAFLRALSTPRPTGAFCFFATCAWPSGGCAGTGHTSRPS